MRFFSRHALRDIRRRKCHFCLAFCSVFAAVLATLTANTLMAQGPMIFLETDKMWMGDYDAIFTPIPTSSWYFDNWFNFDGEPDLAFNYTKVIDEFGDRFNLAPRYH